MREHLDGGGSYCPFPPFSYFRYREVFSSDKGDYRNGVASFSVHNYQLTLLGD